MKLFEEVVFNDEMYAIIIRSDYAEEGIKFFTPGSFSQQLAYMKHPKGKEIVPHVHNKVTREVHYTNEVLVIKKGKLRVDFYDIEERYLESRVLGGGDILLLSSGGHGFEVLEDLEMIEVKQGPFAGDNDKRRFQACDSEQITVKE